MFLLDHEGGNGGAKFRIWQYRPESGDFRRVRDRSRFGAKRWYATNGFRGSLYFYSSPITPEGVVISMPDERSGYRAKVLTYPKITGSGESTRPMDPFLIPGPGKKRLYAFDRTTGKGGLVDFDDGRITRESKI
ncbi:MAG: hypothetical protein ABEN55_09720, partial [Bradymonadaceae bacterium]